MNSFLSVFAAAVMCSVVVVLVSVDFDKIAEVLEARRNEELFLKVIQRSSAHDRAVDSWIRINHVPTELPEGGPSAALDGNRDDRVSVSVHRDHVATGQALAAQAARRGGEMESWQ